MFASFKVMTVKPPGRVDIRLVSTQDVSPFTEAILLPGGPGRGQISIAPGNSPYPYLARQNALFTGYVLGQGPDLHRAREPAPLPTSPGKLHSPPISLSSYLNSVDHNGRRYAGLSSERAHDNHKGLSLRGW